MIQEEKIISLRKKGCEMVDIADSLGISRNTVKSICRQEGLLDVTKLCEYCKTPLVVFPGTKEKKFCSDKCRMKFWNSGLGTPNCDGMEDCVCLNCGKAFKAYPKRKRKYCSHECYVEARFKNSFQKGGMENGQ